MYDEQITKRKVETIFNNIKDHHYPDNDGEYLDSFGIQFHLRETDDLTAYSVNKLLNRTVNEMKRYLPKLGADDIPQFILDYKKGQWLLDIDVDFDCDDCFNLIIKLYPSEVKALLTNLINSGIQLSDINGVVL
jgi:hypothetical protein